MIKKIGNCLYVHKSNVKELYDSIRDDCMFPFIVVTVELHNKYGLKYEVIKYDKRNKKISFIESPDWNISYEPYISYSVVTDINTGNVKVISGRKTNPQIYHHKWMFVADDYKGFDIEASKKRSEMLMSNPSYKENIKIIGNKYFWLQWCKENGFEV